MSGNETRVTKISKLNDGLRSSTECCLVELAGPQIGKRYVLDEQECTIGRDVGNHIVVELDNVSRRHARFGVGGDGTVWVEDLESTNGTYVNDKEVEKQTRQQLRPGDFIKVGGSIFKFLSGNDLESLYHEEIYQLTIVDGLTQVYNKRYFLEFLEREMGRCHRYGRALSLIMFDLDHFKQINDAHGHLAGDYVLRELARSIKPRIRREECFSRYGGEEFAIVLPEIGPDKVRKFSEKLRKIVEDHQFRFEDRDITVTVSMGLADLTAEVTEPLQFIKQADQNLYKAKKAGRNRVVG